MLNTRDHIRPTLSSNQRLITPSAYLMNSWLYDDVIHVVMLVKAHNDYTHELRWMSETVYYTTHEDYTVVKRMFLVNLREAKTSTVDDVFYIHMDEYHKDPEAYEILDTRVRVMEKKKRTEYVLSLSAFRESHWFGITYDIVRLESLVRYLKK